MTIFERSVRKDFTIECAAVLTRRGLYAHGIAPNPLVGPASYMGHTNTYTEEGQARMEEGCARWLRRARAKSLEIDPSMHGERPRTDRLQCSTPLAALVASIERGKAPSDILPASYYAESVSARRSFNVTSTEFHQMDESQGLSRSRSRLSLPAWTAPALQNSSSSSSIALTPRTTGRPRRSLGSSQRVANARTRARSAPPRPRNVSNPQLQQQLQQQRTARAVSTPDRAPRSRRQEEMQLEQQLATLNRRLELLRSASSAAVVRQNASDDNDDGSEAERSSSDDNYHEDEEPTTGGYGTDTSSLAHSSSSVALKLDMGAVEDVQDDSGEEEAKSAESTSESAQTWRVLAQGHKQRASKLAKSQQRPFSPVVSAVREIMAEIAKSPRAIR